MKPELKRIAIAEACGWKKVMVYEWKWNESNTEQVKLPKQFHEASVLPDYPSDLNAMHEAEKALSNGQYNEFCWHMKRLRNSECEHPSICRCLSATAAQRAEAFLKTLGLWREE